MNDRMTRRPRARPAKASGEAPSQHMILAWVARENKARLLVDGALRLEWANCAGHELIAKGDLLSVDASNVVTVRGELQFKIENAINSRAPESLILVDQHEDMAEHVVVRIEMLQEEGGKSYFGLQILRHAPPSDRWLAALARQFQLTPKQSQILMQMIAGKSTEAAASVMDISVETVRTHVRDVYAKLNVGSREELFARVRPFYL